MILQCSVTLQGGEAKWKADEIVKNFGCESSKLIMVGDRPFTDIVFGNRHGLFTILTEPLSHTEKPLIVRQEVVSPDSSIYLKAFTFHPLGIVKPSYSISSIAFLKDPKMGGKILILSLATCQGNPIWPGGSFFLLLCLVQLYLIKERAKMMGKLTKNNGEVRKFMDEDMNKIKGGSFRVFFPLICALN